MNMSKKKAGVAIICGVLFIALGTGLVFAANSNVNSPQAYAEATENTDAVGKSGCAEEGAATPDELAKDYAVYEPFGLTYDKKTNSLYYQGKLVREFQDIMATNGEDLSGGKFSGTIRQFCNDYGEININTVRDFTTLEKNGYGKLTGIEVED
ncbi:MAG: hypothetical protein ACRC3H_01015 [Lachnospiraceae bacterium]